MARFTSQSNSSVETAQLPEFGLVEKEEKTEWSVHEGEPPTYQTLQAVRPPPADEVPLEP